MDLVGLLSNHDLTALFQRLMARNWKQVARRHPRPAPRPGGRGASAPAPARRSLDQEHVTGRWGAPRSLRVRSATPRNGRAYILSRRRTRRSSASVGLLEEGVHAGGELAVVLEEKAVRRVRVDRDPRIRE